MAAEDRASRSTSGSTVFRPDVDVTEVSDWVSVRDGFSCPALSAEQAFGHTYAPLLDQGTMIALDGPGHVQRRRLVGKLLANAEWFRDTILIPTVDRNLRLVLDGADEDGWARMDLVEFNMRVAQQVAAAMVGLDGVDSVEGVDALLAEVRQLGKSEAKLECIVDFDVDSVLPRARAAKQAIHDRFYRDSLERRRALVERYRSGELGEDELPTDLITVLLVHGGPKLDGEIAFREACLMLTAGTVTTSLSTTWTIHELSAWLQEHPEREPLARDNDFLLRAFCESLRLHPGSMANLRRATADVVLSGGTPVPAGGFALLGKWHANRDQAIFGENAESFDPCREVQPGVPGYGLSFGHGPHKCFGMPLVIGTPRAEGVAVQLVSRLLAAGIRPDPDRPAQKFGSEHVVFDHWRTYPVLVREPVIAVAS